MLVAWPTPAAAALRWVVSGLHEGGHALAALASGGAVESIHFSAAGGETHTTDGWPHLILLSGYPAPCLAALALMKLGRRLWWLGWLLGLGALRDILDDLHIGDAAALSTVAPAPPAVWSMLWALLAITMLWYGFRAYADAEDGD
ncbi:MAG: hypothetical protein ACI8S6_003683 [Myxococcota bacterium]